MENALRALLVAILTLLSLPAAAQAATSLKFSEFYVDDFSIAFSEKLKALDGKRVEVEGFMAPPLKPEGSFLVLTRYPVDVCPFCAAEADWPIDILAVYLREEVAHVATKVRVAGTLDIGTKIDAKLGFVSLTRLQNATVVR